MPLKENKIEVKQIFATGVLDFLNGLLEDWLNDGWELLDTKVINADFYNHTFSMFYIFSRKKENK